MMPERGGGFGVRNRVLLIVIALIFSLLSFFYQGSSPLPSLAWPVDELAALGFGNLAQPGGIIKSLQRHTASAATLGGISNHTPHCYLPEYAEHNVIYYTDGLEILLSDALEGSLDILVQSLMTDYGVNYCIIPAEGEEPWQGRFGTAADAIRVSDYTLSFAAAYRNSRGQYLPITAIYHLSDHRQDDMVYRRGDLQIILQGGQLRITGTLQGHAP